MKFFNKIYIFFLFAILVFASCKSDQKVGHATDNSIQIDTFSNLQVLATSIFQKHGDAFIVPWKYLMSVKFEEKYNEKMGMEVSLPIFNDTLKVLDGKLVQVEGFYIPVDETGNEKIVILSVFDRCLYQNLMLDVDFANL